MQRACAAALIRTGDTVLFDPGDSNDDRAALEIIRRLGADVSRVAGAIHISSRGVCPKHDTLDCGESGLSIRMFTPLAALSDRSITVTGSGSLLARPMGFFDQVLPHLGVSIASHAGKLPLQVRGPLVPADLEVDGSLSSQFLTGLLMAYSAARATDRTLHVTGLVSRPYIELTLDILRHFGLHVPTETAPGRFFFPAPDQHRNEGPVRYTVEGDWSGSAFLLVAGAIAGPIAITGLNMDSVQADRAIIDVLRQAGALVTVTGTDIQVSPGPLRSFRFDATDCPDLFPPLAALAAYANGTSEIGGVRRLRYKESDRATALQQECGRMGITIDIDHDSMFILGGSPRGADLHSHEDHRIVMAEAVMGLRASGVTRISGSDAIRKSYPSFFSDLEKLGAVLESES
jgi:3-phosphoshikimate 1-carboxyvinyltransferase